MVLLLCSHLHISAATLLMSDCLEETVDWNAVMASFPPDPHPSKTVRSSGQVRRLLAAALRENDCPSLRELTIRLGFKRAKSLYQVDKALPPDYGETSKEPPNTLVEGAWSHENL